MATWGRVVIDMVINSMLWGAIFFFRKGRGSSGEGINNSPARSEFFLLRCSRMCEEKSRRLEWQNQKNPVQLQLSKNLNRA